MSEREVWFITRPERDPRFHRDGLIALADATNNFTMEWTGNRELHKLYEKKLVEHGVKRANISSDGSGGRTWAALMKTFSYCYINDDGYIVPTKAGIQIINGVNVYENIRKQVLNLQIPNAYFLEAGFRPKFSSDFAVRPVRFLLKLCCRPELDYHLTKEEITFFALPAKKDSDLDRAADSIKQFRLLSAQLQNEVKCDIASELEHRERLDSGARSFEAANSDVAHTFMLIADYTGLAEYARGRALRIDPSKVSDVLSELTILDERYPFNKRYLISLQRMAENSGLDVDSYKANRLGSVKPAGNKIKTQMKVKQLLSSVPNPGDLTFENLAAILSRELPPQEAEEIALEIKSANSIFSLNDDFVEGYLTEKDNRVFEDKTGEIIKMLGFDVEMRPRVAGCSTEIEIIAKYGDDKCGIIDCKNYKQKFILSSSLASHMFGEYIPNYEGYEGRELTFFAYITASDFGGERNLEKISSRAKIHIPTRVIKGIMLNANTLLGFLDICIENQIPPDKRAALFLKSINNCGYNSVEKMIREMEFSSFHENK